MKFKLKITLFLVVLFLSCNRKEELSFPYELIDWMPYEGVTELRYTNYSDTVCFNLVVNTGPMDGWVHSNYIRSPVFVIESDLNEQLNIKIKIIFEAYELDGNVMIHFYNDLSIIESFVINIDNDHSNDEIDEITINEITFQNPVVIDNYVTDVLFRRIVYVREKGLVQFIMNDEEWNLIIE